MSAPVCVFPAATEQEWQTIACADGTALRVWLQAGPDGYVRLQQLACGKGTGWYVQKTFVIPGEALPLLLPQLRQARCLIPATQPAELATPTALRLVRETPPAAEALGA